MSRSRRPHRVRTYDPPHRGSIRELSDDPDYLAFKESLGERLADSERAILDAHRQQEHYRESLERLGGGS
jgi:hypothetical protein